MPRTKKPLHPVFEEMLKRSIQIGEKNDCAVKAVALATDVDYSVALALFTQMGRKPGVGTSLPMIVIALMHLGFKAVSMPTMKRIAMVHRLADEFNYRVQFLTTRQLSMFPLLDPTKTYLIRTSGHIACYKGGQLIDWTETRANRIIDILEVTKA